MLVSCLLLPAPTISWTRWWAKKMLSTSKTDVLSQCYILAIFWPPLFSIISQMKRLYLEEEKIRKCLVHFCVIQGVSVTSVWEEFLLDPLQTIELFFSVFCYMIVISLLLPASTISWTGWWAKKKLKTSKTEVLNQWSVLAKFQKNAAGRGERGGEKNKCR